MTFEEIPYVKYNGIKINNVNYIDTRSMISSVIKNKQRGYVCLNDVSNVIAATKDIKLKQAINESLLSLPDGTPLAWYGRMVGCKEIERISGAALMTGLLSDMTNCKHYLLGDTEQTIDRVIEVAKKINININISGHSPPFKEFDEEDNQMMIDKIMVKDPDIIWVCFGGHKQEKWMNQNVSRLDKGVMIGVGAAFRFLIGDISTPPVIFQKMGLQWLFRMAEEFIKNPTTWLKTVHDRQLLSSKMVYLINLPHEVMMARKQLKQINTIKSP
jgi:N-acetylglucosaminyldiphosphoundecaprenol N-acetyl-beta-D-mannosaminyltransferase